MKKLVAMELGSFFLFSFFFSSGRCSGLHKQGPDPLRPVLAVQ